MKNLVNLMRDDHHGLLFVKDAELPEYSFIAIEAIWWSIERGKDIDHEQTAVSMFQVSGSERDREGRVAVGFVLDAFRTWHHSALYEHREKFSLWILSLLHRDGEVEEL